MRTTVMKRTLSIFMTLLMLISSSSMIFAFAETTHTCADVSPRDHKCDTCNESVGGTLVDFTTTDNVVKYGTDSGVTVTKSLGGIKFSDKAKGTTIFHGVALKDYTLKGNVYEVSYYTDTNGLIRCGLQIINNGTGNIGWYSQNSNYNKMCIITSPGLSSPKVGTYSTINRDNDTSSGGNRQYFKVIVDGINMKMTLYTLYNGVYTQAAEVNIDTAGQYFKDYLELRLISYDALSGSKYVSVGGVTVTKLCSDDNRDHLCDVCKKELTECSDAKDDGDHLCELCGKNDSAACVNTNNDHVCDNDALCERFLDHIYVDGTCSVCGCASHKEIDTDSDNKCDVCQTKMDRIFLFNAIKDKVKLYGRSLNLPDGIACDFSGSGIEFNAHLSGDVKLRVNSQSTSYYTLYINGERQNTRLEFTDGTAEYTIAEDLDEGDYTFKLIKQSMIDYSESAFVSLSFAGTLLDKSEDKDLLIEFVGDSITCGHSLVAGQSAGSNASFDATVAYAYLTAQKLGADHSLVSRSGWALLPDANGSGSVAKNIYPYTSYIRSDNEYVPSRKADIVVIHLGTNDVNYRKDTYDTDFVGAAKEFIAEIQKMNPNAKIVWAYGSMMTGNTLTGFKAKVDTIINDLGGAESGYYSVQLPYDTSGGMSHPTVKTHAASADILAHFIDKTVLGNDNTNYCFDASDDADHACDHCGKATTTCKNENSDHVCDTDSSCTAYADCKDTDNDHYCDLNCGAKLSFCKDTDEPIGICDVCGKDFAHTEADENKDHLCDVCGTNFGEHKAAAGTHTCDHCGKYITGTLVDFSGDNLENIRPKKPDTKVESDLGSIKIYNKTVVDGDHFGTTTDMIVDGHVYEITFTINQTAMNKYRPLFEFFNGSIKAVNGSNKSGHVGWVIYKDGTMSIARVTSYGIDYNSPKVIDRDIDTENDNEQNFKVIVDGIGKNISLWVMKNGEYVKADEIAFTVSSTATLVPSFGNYDTIPDGHYIKMSNVAITELDADKDHLCDLCGEDSCSTNGITEFGKHEPASATTHVCGYCNAAVTKCVDEDPRDHLCDVCGGVLSECFDSETDNDHDCDYCEKENITEHVDNNNDHACDNGCDVVFGECADSAEDSDHVCDYGCGATLEECVDTDLDHACDNGCDVVFGECADSAEDNDHVCDYGCGATLEECVDTDLDHACDNGCDVVFGECTDSIDDGDYVCDYGCGKEFEPVYVAISQRDNYGYRANIVRASRRFNAR